jgi:hypothetical protein
MQSVKAAQSLHWMDCARPSLISLSIFKHGTFLYMQSSTTMHTNFVKIIQIGTQPSLSPGSIGTSVSTERQMSVFSSMSLLNGKLKACHPFCLGGLLKMHMLVS